MTGQSAPSASFVDKPDWADGPKSGLYSLPQEGELDKGVEGNVVKFSHRKLRESCTWRGIGAQKGQDRHAGK